MSDKHRIDALERCCENLHWMARRYADNRTSYVTSLFNDITRELLSLGVKLNPTGDQIIWARDSMGNNFARISQEEATPGTPEALGKTF